MGFIKSIGDVARSCLDYKKSLERTGRLLFSSQTIWIIGIFLCEIKEMVP